MSFHYPLLLWLLPLILLGALYYQRIYREREYKVKVWLLASVLVLVLLALAKPYKEAGLVDVDIEGTEIVIAVDLSASMKGEDLKPNRLEYTKTLLTELIQQSKHDKFAILGFTSSAIILSTMTNDKKILVELFERLDNTNIVSKSTTLMPVLELATKLSQLEKRQLLVFTDGGDQSFSKEIDFAKAQDLSVYCIGMATHAGVALKQDDGNFLLNTKEEIVISSLNTELDRLARESGGSFFSFDTPMAKVLESIKQDAQNYQKSQSKERLEAQLFYYFLIPALILFLIATTSFLNFIALFLILLIVPAPNYAGVTDFYHIQAGAKAFVQKDYDKAADHYDALGDKNWQALFNQANSYYKLGDFRQARSLYGRIQTKDAKLKSKLFYNIGNCFYREGEIEKARIAFQKSLALDFQKDTAENLIFLEDKFDTKRSPKTHHAKNMIEDELNRRSFQQGEKKKKKSGGGKSQHQQGDAKSGAGSSKMQSQAKKQKASSVPQVGLSPKQYKLINKGSTYEQNPW